ncbi:MAG: indolepyruvate ferredoxin oxidoreductase [Candidatus Accumulibacter phosphatis]|uniref:Indolepyruvate ferredoxin oxidoreductase n=1 Tax=Candidatus Accumulibacter phosphatis TaxID=327160 RepID=A0A080LWG7_9PROT|nr:MAG: indolepyruvate ferredoxin oxidoreductase [Candidatus Accumulibacter phosphatis]
MQSNCLAVIPVETEFGRKRAIDQSACNKDFSCIQGFCPSFVSVEGGRLRRGRAITAAEAVLPEPLRPDTRRPYNILITGVGGTGVVTLGALLGMAAHLDGKGVSVLDMTGLAQKFGAVFSHLRIADRPEDIHAARIATGEAHAVIGGDLVVSAGAETLSKVLAGKTRAVVNVAETPTAEFTRNPDWQFPQEHMQEQISEACGKGNTLFLDTAAMSRRLMGDALYGNLLLLGVAWQRGLVPLSLAAIDQAIELNAAAVEQNRQAFLWGRRAAHDPEALQSLLKAAGMPAAQRLSQNLDEFRPGIPPAVVRRIRGRLPPAFPPRATAARQTRSGDRQSPEKQLRAMDDACLQGVEPVEEFARNDLRSLRENPGTPDGKATACRLRGRHRTDAGAAPGGNPGQCHRTGQGARADSWLWSCQGCVGTAGTRQAGNAARATAGRGKHAGILTLPRNFIPFAAQPP